jgi:glycosyltransferase involved in cell wall biosynthesis
MNIGYIVQQFYPSAYGSGIHAFELSQELVKLGHEIHIITKGEPTQEPYEHFKNIHIHRILRSLALPYYFPFNSGLLWQYGQELIRKCDIDIVIGHGFEASLYFKIRKHIPFIYKAAGTIGLQAYRRNLTWRDAFGKLYFPFLGQFEKTAAKQSDCVIAISDTVKQELITNYNIAPQMISRIYNGVNNRRFHPRQQYSHIKQQLEIDSQKIILFVGRLSPIKGPQLLIQAIPRITKTFSDVIFLFIGNGPLSSYLHRMAYKLNISRFVKFLGFISNAEIPKYFAIADLCVIPSLYEPFGLVALESLASGTPILSSAQGGLAEIHKILGIFPTIMPLTPSTISKNVVALLTNYEKLKSLGKEGRKLVCQKFTWRKCAEKTNKILEKIKWKRKKIKGF